MNKLVVIGNGFDLAHGLKTSYTDFVLWHLNKVSNNFDLHGKDLLVNFESNRKSKRTFPTISDFFFFTKNYDYGYKSTFKSKFYQKIVQKLVSNKKEINWVDIENEYFKELVSVLDPYLKSNVNIDSDNEIDDIINLNNSLNNIKLELEEYIYNLPGPIYNGIIGNILYNLAQKSRDDDGKILFLNFNYTSTIQLYNSVFPQKLDVVNIHGKLKDDKNPVIFGYGDESNDYFEKIEKLNNNELTRHLKSFSYLTTQNYQNLFDFLNKQEFEVHVMGHSLGLSDRLLFNHIFEHEKFKKVQLYYYEYERDGIVVNDFFQKTQELSRHFKLDSKHKMRTNVVPFNESRPLNKSKSQN